MQEAEVMLGISCLIRLRTPRKRGPAGVFSCQDTVQKILRLKEKFDINIHINLFLCYFANVPVLDEKKKKFSEGDG